MGYTVKEIEYKGMNIEIQADEDPMNPRTEWDNICVFHIGHRRYGFGDENYNDGDSMRQAENEAVRNGDIVLPLYMYDHSGITISLSPFSCPWDSGQVGFVQVPKKKIIEEFGKKIFTPALKKRAMKIAEGEVKTLDDYLRGNVYGYVITDKDGEEIDSCWSFFGDYEKYLLDEAKGMIDWKVKENRKEHCQQVKNWIKNKVALIYRQSECLA
jgi:hypothetical protein